MTIKIITACRLLDFKQQTPCWNHRLPRWSLEGRTRVDFWRDSVGGVPTYRPTTTVSYSEVAKTDTIINKSLDRTKSNGFIIAGWIMALLKTWCVRHDITGSISEKNTSEFSITILLKFSSTTSRLSRIFFSLILIRYQTTHLGL